MKIFMDTADVDEIVGMAELGIVYGVTTKPSLIAKSGRTPDYYTHLTLPTIYSV